MNNYNIPKGSNNPNVEGKYHYRYNDPYNQNHINCIDCYAPYSHKWTVKEKEKLAYSSYKNHYLEELLTTKSISVFGTEGIKDSLIKAEFKDGAFKSRIDNRKYTTLIKKKIYMIIQIILLVNLKCL